MSLQPHPLGSVPEETARVAHAAYPKGNLYLRLSDHLGAIYEDRQFAALYPNVGQPAYAPWRLALISILQFLEGLSDRQAADMVRGRIDWKYLLGLELTDSGFDHTVLSEFRSRLLREQSAHLLFETLVTQLREQGYLKERGRQRSDSTHILAMVHALNRVECVGETFRHALNALAIVAPEWCLAHLQPEWTLRYDHRVEDYRLPKGEEARLTLALAIGADGNALLEALYASNAPVWLREIPAIETLRRIWIQNYFWEEDTLRWRSKDDLPPAACFISSPYDLDAVYNKKRTLLWVGYKAHFTEACDDDVPHLITHVETTKASVTDDTVTERIHSALQEKRLLPQTHVVDTGYVDAKLLVESQQTYGIDLLGPTREDYQEPRPRRQRLCRQTFSGRLGATARHLSDIRKTSISWTPHVNRHGTEAIKVRFSRHRLSKLSLSTGLHQRPNEVPATAHQYPSRRAISRPATGTRSSKDI